MRERLKRGVPLFAAIGIFAVVGDVALRIAIHRNRVAQSTYLETVAHPGMAKAIDDWERQRPVVKSDAAKHNRAMDAISAPDWSGVRTKLSAAEAYDDSYYTLDRWRFAVEAIAVISTLLAVSFYAVLQVIARRNAQS